jgi:hypothetical protein
MKRTLVVLVTPQAKAVGYWCLLVFAFFGRSAPRYDEFGNSKIEVNNRSGRVRRATSARFYRSVRIHIR